MRLATVSSLLACIHAICDGQHADVTLTCNSACQYQAQQTSTGCGVLWDQPCYQCCWTACLSYTIEGGACGGIFGTQAYEDCSLGGSCLVGHCPFAPSSGGDGGGGGGYDYDDDDGGGGGLGAGPIAGITAGSLFSLVLLAAVLCCICKANRSANTEHLTELAPPAIK